MFNVNGYPSCLFESCVNKFLNSKCQYTAENVSTVRIPYIGQSSFIFKKKLQTIFKKCLDIDINCIFYSHKIAYHFFLEHKTPQPLLSNVIYQFKCLRDVSLSYIGKTKRHLVTWVKEHASGESAISEHLLICDTTILMFIGSGY